MTTETVTFTVQLKKSNPETKTFKLKVHHDWAPLGAARFMELVTDKNFDGGAFYRVIPGFMAQFGISADPAKYAKWSATIKDDKVTQSNRRGTMSYAMRGPDTRSCQVFINFGNNDSLDAQGFAPFAEVIDGGMDVVDALYGEYQGAPYETDVKGKGNAAFVKDGKDLFPHMSYVVKVEKD